MRIRPPPGWRIKPGQRELGNVVDVNVFYLFLQKQKMVRKRAQTGMMSQVMLPRKHKTIATKYIVKTWSPCSQQVKFTCCEQGDQASGLIYEGQGFFLECSLFTFSQTRHPSSFSLFPQLWTLSLVPSHESEHKSKQMMMMMSFICSCRNKKEEPSSICTLRRVRTIRGCLEGLTLMI
jgi:hypothetical protein